MKKIKLTKKIKKGKKIILLMPIIISILLVVTKVYAGTQDSNLVRNQVEGIYAVAPLSDKTHLYNLEIYEVNGKIAYCIQLGRPVTTNIYNSTQDITEQSKITKFTPKKLEYIKIISYFGYGYKGHNDYKYYMAAQEMMWESLYSVNVSWTNELDINGPKINIESYKNEIKELVKKYKEELSLSATLDCKVGDTITLTDPKNILSLYNIKSKGNQKANINNNILTINISNNYIGQDVIVLEKENYYDYSSVLYYYEDSQSLISSGNLDDNNKNKTITLNIVGETLTTNLIDQDTKTNTPSGQATLVGAEYEVYDKNKKLVATFTTDKLGENQIPNLYHDKYYIKQTKASKGYKLNEKIYEIDLNSQNNKLTLVEEVIKSTIEINKLYELGDNPQREVGIQFNIYDNKDKLYNSITTTEQGPDTVTLPYGIYKVKQMNSTYGYDKIKDIEIVIDENTNPTVKYYLLDKKILSKLHITTKDKITKDNIKEENILYKIKDKETNRYITYIDQDNNKITEFPTNKNGELTLPIQLPYGKYIIEQAATPSRYLTNKEKIRVTINDKTEYSYINDQVVINIDYLNTPIIGKINVITNKETIITKNNNYEKILEKRKNIEIELYRNKELINSYQTDKNGNLEITDLQLGEYCIKEKNSNREECVKLINKDNKTKIVEKNVELTEIINTSNVTINNIDTKKEPVSDSTIELYKDNDLINSSITDKDGYIKINNLAKGNYCFKQTKVSPKYILNEEKICFTVDDNSKNIKLTLINKLNEKQLIKIPDTLSNKRNYLFLIFMLLTIIGVIIYKKKRNNTNI